MKPAQIPVFSIKNFSSKENEITYIETIGDTKNLPLHLPYRTAHYGFGIVLEGKATIKINLDEYQLEKNSIVSIAPEPIKQWVNRSKDFKTITIFFSKSFLNTYFHNPTLLHSLQFLEFNAAHCINLTAKNAKIISDILLKIKQTLNNVHPYKITIVANYLQIALLEYATIYNNYTTSFSQKPNRAQQINTEFRKLVSLYFKENRTVQYYAKLLFITPKHLIETIKSETGKSAGEWIDEMVMLEAKVLLQNKQLSISQIAEQLNFPDQSSFGKFFKNLHGVSPLAYKKSF